MDSKYFVWKSEGARKRYKDEVGDYVKDAIMEFCAQNAEFAQAVEQSGKTFDACLEAITDGVGCSISDLELFKRAVRFYFDGASVKFSMRVILCGEEEKERNEITVGLDWLLDF